MSLRSFVKANRGRRRQGRFVAAVLKLYDDQMRRGHDVRDHKKHVEAVEVQARLESRDMVARPLRNRGR